MLTVESFLLTANYANLREGIVLTVESLFLTANYADLREGIVLTVESFFLPLITRIFAKASYWRLGPFFFNRELRGFARRHFTGG